MSLTSRRVPLIRLSLTLGLLACTALPTVAQEQQPAQAQEQQSAQGDKVVATIDGEPVTENDLSVAEEALGQQFARLAPEQRRAAALSAITEIRLLAKDAETEGLDKDPNFQRQMEFLRQRALHTALVEKKVAGAITDDEIRARYDKEMADTPPTNEVRARHILVKTKEEADDIIKQLDGGADFDALAKEKSQDPGSGAQGGDLGYFAAGQMVPEFEKAAFALDVGSYTKEPVQSQFGWHVIKVEDKRAKQPPAFEQIKEQVRSLLIQEKYLDLVKTLRGQAKVEVADPELKKIVEQAEQGAQPAQPEQTPEQAPEGAQ